MSADDDLQLELNTALGYMFLGTPRESIETLLNLPIEQFCRPEAQLVMVSALLQAGHWAAGEAMARLHLKYNRPTAYAWFLIAFAVAEQGDIQGARDFLQNAVDLDPHVVETARESGLVIRFI
jgi:uncharacterized membrane-anchored protein